VADEQQEKTELGDDGQKATVKVEEKVTTPESEKPEEKPAEQKPEEKPSEEENPEEKEASPKEEKPAESKGEVPDKYELLLDENSLIDESRVQEIASLARDLGLSNEQAQKLVDREHGAAQAGVDSFKKTVTDQSEVWLSKSKADKEIGGEFFEETVDLANNALETLFPGMEIRKIMDDSGLGNHPSVLKGFAKIGKMLNPTKIEKGGSPPAKPSKSLTQKLYDHPTSQQQT
jgi:hypothetical protein